MSKNQHTVMKDAADVIPSEFQVGKTVASKEIETVDKLTTGWDALPSGRVIKTYHSKPNPDTWNSSDLQWYLKNTYQNRYGATLHIPIAYGHQAIKEIKFAMAKKLGSEPPHSVVKAYFDFIFERHADDIIRERGNFPIYQLTKLRYIWEFVDLVGGVPKTKASEVFSAQNVLGMSIDDFVTAYRIGGSYFVMNYGLVIPVNFLILSKGKTVKEAKDYVRSTLGKITKFEKEVAIKATRELQPYPNWLPCVNFSDLDIEIATCEDSKTFEHLKKCVK